MGYVLVVLLAVSVWIYAIVEVVTADESEVRNLPKFLWLFAVLVVPTVGSVAWFVLGRPRGAPVSLPRRPATSEPPRVVGPEDSPGFIAGLEQRAREARHDDDTGESPTR